MLLYVVNVIHHDKMKRFTKLKKKMRGKDSEIPSGFIRNLVITMS